MLHFTSLIRSFLSTEKLLNQFDCPQVFSIICEDFVIRAMALVPILKSTVVLNICQQLLPNSNSISRTFTILDASEMPSY